MKIWLAAIVVGVASISSQSAGSMPVHPLGPGTIPGQNLVGTFIDGNLPGVRIFKVHRSHYCRRRRGKRLLGMVHRQGRHICRYRDVRRRGNGRWRATASAWRHCVRKYGGRVTAAYENRTKWRCRYKRR